MGWTLQAPIRTNVPSIRIGELLPALAQHMDKCAILRSMTRRCPIALGRHLLDHFLAIHGLTSFHQHAEGGVQSAGLLGLRLLRLLALRLCL
jgi:hypothetical protein